MTDGNILEHEPWVGPLYASEGVHGQRLAIVGYSCWVCPDDPTYTVKSVRNVVDGRWPNVRFYNDIASYFQMEPPAFYERVVMFEFVPCAIGGPDERYATATPEQADVGRRRLLRIAREHRVEKLLIFSAKAWRSRPPTVDELVPLGVGAFQLGHYAFEGRKAAAIGLRHPQYAPRRTMTAAVERALALPVHS